MGAEAQSANAIVTVPAGLETKQEDLLFQMMSGAIEVLNDADQKIGSIDDLLISTDGKDPYAVLSVGGFLGMGTHLVVVPYASLKVVDNKVMLPGGTKAALEKLPEFQFAAK
jgi:hypothetical protein